MGRVHLFEFGDQPWFPDVLHQAMTDFLAFAANTVSMPYLGFAAKLQAAMAAMNETMLLDLCSGGSGPVPTLVEILTAQGYPVRARLTDRSPSLARLAGVAARSGGAIDFVREPVDALEVPDTLEGFRLIINGLHHFCPADARHILADAVRKRRGIAVLEATERSAAGIFWTLVSPLTILLVTPFIRPFRVSRFVFTYLVPLVPLCTAWDGVVSCLRVYAPDEIHALVRSLPPNDYVWDIGRLPVAIGLPAVTYLIGRPASG